MITTTIYTPTQTSGDMRTAQASIVMTAQMFRMLSSDIYTNKPLAVVRETICNGRDSHKMAGEDRPLTLHLPNKLEPFYSIRDYGTGLSEDDIMEMYLVYGMSTKTNTNSMIGGKGIGSKSPLAYADAFIVESYFEGVKTSYSVYLDKGIPNVSKLGQSLTTEPTGLLVKVAIASQDFELFYSATKIFLKYFDYPVEVVGAIIDTTAKVLIDNDFYTLYESTGSEYNSSEVKATMGGVVYDISNTYTRKLDKLVRSEFLVLKFGIGDLEIAPSREALSEDKDTIKKIEELVELADATYYDEIQNTLDDGDKSPSEVYELLSKFRLIKCDGWGGDAPMLLKVAAEDLTYNGKGMDDILKLGLGKLRCIRKGYGKHTDNHRKVLELPIENTVFLVLDRVMGSIKTACEISRRTNKYVALISVDDKPFIESWYGTGVKYEIMTEKYEQYYPKKERGASISVARSGIFSINMSEIKELKAESEGYYIGFNNYTATTPNTPVGFADHYKLDEYRALIQTMQTLDENIFGGNPVYVCRKGGLPSVRKTQIKELTFDVLISKLRELTTKESREDYILWDAKVPSLLPSCLDEAWEIIKQEYPQHSKHDTVKIKAGKGFHLMVDLDESVLNKLIPDLVKGVLRVSRVLHTERSQFRKDFPIIGALSHYLLDTDCVQNIIDLFNLQMKRIKDLTDGTEHC